MTGRTSKQARAIGMVVVMLLSVVALNGAFVGSVAAQTGDGIDVENFDQITPADVVTGQSGTQSQAIVDSGSTVTLDTDGSGDVVDVEIQVEELSTLSNVNIGSGTSAVSLTLSGGTVKSDAEVVNDRIEFTVDPGSNAGFTIDSLSLDEVGTSSSTQTATDLSYRMIAFQGVDGAGQDSGAFSLTSTVDTIGEASPDSVPIEVTGLTQEIVPNSISIDARSGDQIDVIVDTSALTDAGATVSDVSVSTSGAETPSNVNYNSDANRVEFSVTPDSGQSVTVDSIELTGVDTSGVSADNGLSYSVQAEQVGDGDFSTFTADQTKATGNFDLINAGVTDVDAAAPADILIGQSTASQDLLTGGDVTVSTKGTQDTTVTVDVSAIGSDGDIDLSNAGANVKVDDGTSAVSANNVNVDAENNEITFTTGTLNSVNFDITTLELTGIDASSKTATATGLTYNIEASQETVSANTNTNPFALTSQVDSIGQASPVDVAVGGSSVTQEIVPNSINIDARSGDQIDVVVDVSSLTTAGATISDVSVSTSGAETPSNVNYNSDANRVEFSVTPDSGQSVTVDSIELTGVDTSGVSADNGLSYSVQAEQVGDGTFSEFNADVTQTTTSFSTIAAGVTSVGEASPNSILIGAGQTDVTQSIVTNSVTVQTDDTSDTTVTVDVSAIGSDSNIDLSGPGANVKVDDGTGAVSANNVNVDAANNEITFSTGTLDSANFDITTLELTGIDASSKTATATGLTYNIDASQAGISANQDTGTFDLTSQVNSIGQASPTDIGVTTDATSGVSQELVTSGGGITIDAQAGPNEQIDVIVDISDLTSAGGTVSSASISSTGTVSNVNVDNTNNRVEFSVTPTSGTSVDISSIELTGIDTSSVATSAGLSYSVQAEQVGDGDFSTFSADVTQATTNFDLIDSGVNSVAQATPNDVLTDQSSGTATIVTGTPTVDTQSTADTTVTVDVSALTSNNVDLSSATANVEIDDGGSASANNINLDTTNNEITFSTGTLSSANFDITTLELTGIDTTGVSTNTGLTYDVTAEQDRVEVSSTSATFDLITPAESSLSNLQINSDGSSTSVSSGTDGDITVEVENTGDASSTFTVDLTITDSGDTDDVTTSQTTTSLSGGGSETVTFSDPISGLEADNYDVEVATTDDTQTGTLTVTGGVDSVDSVSVGNDFAGISADDSQLPVTITGIEDSNGNALNAGQTVTVEITDGTNTFASGAITLDNNGEVTDGTVDTTSIDGANFETGEATVSVTGDTTDTTTTVDLVDVAKDLSGSGYQIVGTSMPVDTDGLGVVTERSAGPVDITTWDPSANSGSGGYVGADETQVGAGYYTNADRIGFDLVEDTGQAQIGTDELQAGHNIVGATMDINTDANVEVGNDLQPTDISNAGVIAYTQGASGISQARSSTTVGQFEAYIVYVENSGEERSIVISGFDPSTTIQNVQ